MPRHSAAGVINHPTGRRVACSCRRTFPLAEFEFHLFVEQPNLADALK